MFYTDNLLLACSGCSVEPLTDYANNEVFQELDDYFTNSDGRLYLDLGKSKGYTSELEKLTRDDSGITLKTTLKASTTKKIRLKVWRYLLGEYLYLLSPQGLTMRYETYTVAKENDVKK